MKLDQAIEILTNLNQQEEIVGWLDIKPAIELGIEALKYVTRLRAYSIQSRQERLPGEDAAASNPAAEAYLRMLKESPLGREPKG